MIAWMIGALGLALFIGALVWIIHGSNKHGTLSRWP